MRGGGGCGPATSPVAPVVGGAETLLQAVGPEVDVGANSVAPVVSTPFEVCLLYYACSFSFLVCIFYAF